MLELCAAALLAYLAGSVTFGMFVPVLLGASRDVRKEGSGNVGATNVLRTYGKFQGALVLTGDLLKGSLAAGIGLWLAGMAGGSAAGVCAVLGHCFPLYFGFKGGKGVATAAGVVFVLFPQSMLILIPVFIATTAVFRFVSLGSIFAALALLVSLAVFPRPAPVAAFCVFAAAMVIWKHQGNIRRILAGTENKLGEKKQKKPPVT